MSEITERLKTAIADRYVIERELGQGGMATVYLAHDVKHDRKVALKVLRPELAAVIGAERFLQEIRVTANLQHSHILPLYDSGAAEGFLFYVMPYMEGETLRTRIDRETQLGIDAAIEITKSVASALDYAHRHDVIHRDIKPENILIHDGQPLVADFGIALAVSQAGANRLTETGLSIGTPQYMSPEQAMGDRELDARSDIYSLGAVLYELLVGEPPYTGPTAQAIVAKVITEKAAFVTAIRDTVPGHVAGAIHKALAKLPADRFASAAEFADALTRPESYVAAPGISESKAAEPARRVHWKTLAPWGAAVVFAAVALWALTRPAPTRQIGRFNVVLPDSLVITTGVNGSSITISPDGSRMVFVGPERRLYVREMGQLGARVLPGTQAAHTPTFSPDGEWIVFHAQGSIKKVALGGGPPITLWDETPTTRGLSWGSDDAIVFTPRMLAGLHRIAAAGGPVDTLTVPDTAAGELAHRWPHVLPGGRAVIFTSHTDALEEATISVLSLESGEIAPLIGGTFAVYLETGHLLYATATGALLAVPFDAGRLEITGGPVSLAEGLMGKATGVAEFAVSRTGTLLHLSGVSAQEELVWVRRDGSEQTIDSELRRDFEHVAVSPDGARIAVSIDTESDPTDIWIYHLERGTLSRLTFEGQLNTYPFWTPDGRSVSFQSNRAGSTALYTKPWDGSGAADVTLRTTREVQEGRWFPDGRTLFIREGPTGAETGRDLLIARAGDTVATPFLVTEFDERAPVLSPDGAWVAYVSNESGQWEVYVRPVPGPGGRWQVSTDGGIEPLWAHSGRELFYRSRDGLWSVPVRTSPTFSFDSPEFLFFTQSYEFSTLHTNYDVSPDDQRFLMIKQSGGQQNLIVVLNWFEELRERLGASR